MRNYISNLLFVTGALTMLVLGLIFDYSLLAFVLSTLQYIAALIVHGKEKARTD
jgi:VIT1/CCC1 family predicted Fe2+/Mn2+ transporter